MHPTVLPDTIFSRGLDSKEITETVVSSVADRRERATPHLGNVQDEVRQENSNLCFEQSLGEFRHLKMDWSASNTGGELMICGSQ